MEPEDPPKNIDPLIREVAYVRKLEQYYRDMTELRVLDASHGDYFICEVCQFASSSDYRFGCKCEIKLRADACFRCVHLLRDVEIENGICKCKVCGITRGIPDSVYVFPMNKIVKPRFPFSEKEE